jgi:hypothetical protein
MVNFLKECLSLLQTFLILLLVYFTYQNAKTVKQEKDLTCNRLINEYEALKNHYSQLTENTKKIHLSNSKATEEEEMRRFYYETLLSSSAETSKLKLEKKKLLIEQYCGYDDK